MLEFESEVMVFDEIWLLGVMFCGFMFEWLSEYKGLFYVMFEMEFGMWMICVMEKICVVVVDLVVVDLLYVLVGFLLLLVECVFYMYGDWLVEV